MVEEEELAYQIDAAATAARQQQEMLSESAAAAATSTTPSTNPIQQAHYTSRPTSSMPLSNSTSSASPSSFSSSPTAARKDSGQEVPPATDMAVIKNRNCCESNSNSTVGNDGQMIQSKPSSSHLQKGHPSPLPDGYTSAAYLAELVSQNASTDSFDDESGSDSEEDRERKRRELEKLEQEFVNLGLQRYQDLSSDSPELHMLQAKLAQQKQQKKQAQCQTQQLETQALEQTTKPLTISTTVATTMPRRQSHQGLPRLQPPLPSAVPRVSASQPPSPMQRPYQRRRQNSLTYDERQKQQDVRWQLQQLPLPSTKPSSSPSPPMVSTRSTVNFLEGVDLDLDLEEDSDENEDSVVLAVAHRVSIRHHADWAVQLGCDRHQRPSWDAGRGVSWTPLSRTQQQQQQHQQQQQQNQRQKLSSRFSETPMSTRSMIIARG
ncbi:hypothetical protein EDD11_009503 [Mortierella claussenii]|nr:hypothetical protein EDD11_009503 [Mortierella claussenii]